VSTRFTKSVIKSCAALSYVEAQARMDDRFVWEEGHTYTFCISFYFSSFLSLMFENDFILIFYDKRL
jgi:hypothetical protein